jgi:hypothetical protein
MKGGFTIDTSGLRRAATRARSLPARVADARKKAVVSLQRRLRTEAARKISEVQLNVAPRSLAPLLSVTASSAGKDADYVSVNASTRRIPIALFRPRVSKRNGVTVTIWHHRGPQHWQHAFRHAGAIKQRIPAKGSMKSGPSGLVHRLPLTNRVGPSLARTLRPIRGYATDFGRDQVVAHLTDVGQSILAAEIRRIINAGI